MPPEEVKAIKSTDQADLCRRELASTADLRCCPKVERRRGLRPGAAPCRATLILAALLLAGCGGPQDLKGGWQPLHGDPYITPKYDLTFYWVGAAGAYQTPEQAAQAIDAAYFEWQSLYEARWGYTLDRFRRQEAIQQIRIQLFADWRVPGKGDPGHTFGIWWPWERQIDSAMLAPYHWDLGLGRWSEGLENLMHEWSHVLQGEYHP